jgi:lipopolysaccharide transport system permease protein
MDFLFHKINHQTDMLLSSKQKKWLDFLFALTSKEIKTRYKNTKIGLLWGVVNPIFQMLVIGFVFQFLLPNKIENYFVFLFSGLLPWNFFSQSILQGTSSIVDSRALIKKGELPKELIIFSIVLANLIHLVVSLTLFCIVLIILKTIDTFVFSSVLSFAVGLFVLIPLVFWLAIFVISILFFTSAIQVKKRDMNFILKSGIPFLFYTVPIIYSIESLPSYFPFLLQLNPLVIIVQGFQSTLSGSIFINNNYIIYGILFSSLLFYLGNLYFKKKSPYFDDFL